MAPNFPGRAKNYQCHDTGSTGQFGALDNPLPQDLVCTMYIQYMAIYGGGQTLSNCDDVANASLTYLY